MRNVNLDLGLAKEKGQATARERGRGILLVDEDPLVRQVLRRWLERDGFRVWPAASGAEAIALFRDHTADIAAVLLNVRMPGLDGPHTLDILRSINPGIPACFMTGNAGGYEIDDPLRHGARCVLDKPLQPEEVSRLLGDLTEGALEDSRPHQVLS